MTRNKSIFAKYTNYYIRENKLLVMTVKKHLCFLFLLLIIFVRLSAQTDDIFYSQNFKKINLEDSTSFNILDESIKNQKLFLFGEIHRVSCNFKILFSLLKYLHKNHKLRYLLTEYDFSDSVLYNKFLETGDTTYLKYTGAEYWQEERDFIKKLRAFNQKTSIEDRIKIIGVDNIYDKDDYITAIHILQRIVLASDIEQSYIHDLVFKGKNLDSVSRGAIKKNLKKMKKDFLKNSENYKKLDIIEYKKFHDILLSLENKRMNKREREEQLSNNILKAYQEFGHKGSFLGHFGSFHTQYVKEEERMINLLRNSTTFSKKEILTINAEYEKCFSNYFIFKLYSYDKKKFDKDALGCMPEFVFGEFGKHLKHYAKHDFNLINVDNLVSEEYQKKAGCDYILFIRNQPGSTSIERPEIKVKWDFKWWDEDF